LSPETVHPLFPTPTIYTPNSFSSNIYQQPIHTTTTSPSNIPLMGISLFDGKDDSYWWVLCVEKFFKE
jgi:hypothetical protein